MKIHFLILDKKEHKFSRKGEYNVWTSRALPGKQRVKSGTYMAALTSANQLEL